jgi:hypothetical protein
MSITDERLRILKLIENGQVSAEEGERLIEALGDDAARERTRASTPPRTLRVRVTDLNTRRSKVNVTIPVSLVGIGMKLGARLIPRASGTTAEEIMRAIESGATGRVFEMQDLDEGERVEIFVE